MELDDFFGNKQQDRKFDPNHGYHDNQSQTQNFRHPYQRHASNYKWLYFLEKLKKKQTAKRTCNICIHCHFGNCYCSDCDFTALNLKTS